MFVFCLTSAEEIKTDCNSKSVDRCLSRIAQRDTSAFDELYHRTSVSVYSFALSILKNVQDAEDVLHDCYVLIYSAAEGYRPHGKPMAWILTITRNLCLKRLRERNKAADIPPEDWEIYFRTNVDMTAEDRAMISKCLQTLSDEKRQIVVLHAVSGFKHREIADLMELTVSTVLSKYNRALKKLRQIL